MFRATTSTGILGARVCSLCRTYCDWNRWLRFSPFRVLRLHMHLSWGTSRQHIQCLRRATQVLEYLAPAPLTYAAPFATATGGLNSLPVEPTVHSCTCGDTNCAGTSIARCTRPLVGTCAGTISILAPAPVTSSTPRWHKQCLTPRKHKYWCTSRLCFQPLPDLLRLQQGAQFSPCRAHRLHLHLWWSTSRRHQQFMLHLRLSWCTSR